MRVSLRRFVIAGAGIAIFVACRQATTDDEPPVRLEATAGPAESDDADRIPCAPRAVLQNICQYCHQAPPVRGAPFPLVTRSQIVRPTVDGEVRLRMIEQLREGRMPLAPKTITPTERATLLGWLEAGAPAEEPRACTPSGEDAGRVPSDASPDHVSAPDGALDAARDGGADAGEDDDDGGVPP